MEQYYKSYYLKEYNKTSLDIVMEIKYGYRVFNSDELDCKIAEVLDSKTEVSRVYYYKNTLTKEIKEYHTKHYKENIILAICEELNNGIRITLCEKFEPSLYLIETYYEGGKPKLRQEFNKDFELVEYVQCIYDTEGNLIEEKFFYADSWTIHTEKTIL